MTAPIAGKAGSEEIAIGPFVNTLDGRLDEWMAESLLTEQWHTPMWIRASMSIFNLPRTLHSVPRVMTIMRVLSKYGFGWAVERLQLQNYVPSMDWFRRSKQVAVHEPDVDPMESIGIRIAKAAEELGPTFVKLAQMASTRPDILPAEIIAELSRLQDDVQPFPAEQAKRVFRDNIGTDVGEAFRQFTDEPFASGSIGQVHRAITKDDRDVVVKIKRPGVDQTIATDMYILRFLAERAEMHLPEIRPYRPKMLVDEFAESIRRELDFINEASTTARFHEAFAGDAAIKTPAVHWELTGPSVLTLEFMQGITLREALDEKKGVCDFKQLANSLAECFLKQYFEMAFFHSDPHPGNLLIQPPNQIVVFDFGMTAQLSDDQAGNLVIAIFAAVNHEIDAVIDVFSDLGAVGRETDRNLLRRDLGLLLDKYYGLPIKRMDLGELFPELLETVRRNDVALPREFVALLKSLATVSGVVLQLDPDFDLLGLIKPKLKRMLAERVSPRRMARMLGMSTWHILSVLRDAPRALRDMVRHLGRGHVQVNIKHENIDHLANELDRSSNRLALAVLTAATIVGSSMLLAMSTDVTVLHVPIRYIGLAGYALSLIMGIGLVIAILRSGRLS